MIGLLDSVAAKGIDMDRKTESQLRQELADVLATLEAEREGNAKLRNAAAALQQAAVLLQNTPDGAAWMARWCEVLDATAPIAGRHWAAPNAELTGAAQVPTVAGMPLRRPVE